METTSVEQTTGIIAVFEQGGFIMYPLLIFSIVTWMVAIYKYLALASFIREYKNIYKEVAPLISSGRTKELMWPFKKASATIANAHEALFDENMVTREDYNEKLYRRLDSTAADLKKGMWVLGSIASSAPFVGLFGTVVGIMESFHSIGAAGGKGGFNVVSAGISEALVATAAGIIIAVIALLFYNYFQVKVQNVFHDFKNRVEDLAQILFIMRGPGQAPQLKLVEKEEEKRPANMSQKMKILMKTKEAANGR